MINTMKKKCWKGIQFNPEWSGKVSLGSKKMQCFVQWLTSRKDFQKSYSFLYSTMLSVDWLLYWPSRERTHRRERPQY